MNFFIQLIFLLIASQGNYAIYKPYMSNVADDETNSYRSFRNDYRTSTLHTVKIFSRESTKTLKGYSCSGSIISNYWIVSAAHCVDGFSVFDVFIGNVTNDIDHVVKASKAFIHPNFDYEHEVINDIALIKLRRSLATLNNTFQIISLPSLSDNARNFTGLRSIVSGYGKLGDSGPTSNFANFAHYEILPLSDCQNLFLNNYTLYTQSNICAKGINASSCEGDSGQGLVIYRKGKRKLIGIASKGLESCEIIEPELFTRVDIFLEWIHSVMLSQ